MREIKFRAKRSDGSGWVYGDLRQENSGNKVIMTNLNTWRDNDDRVDAYGENIIVNPNTIGQYTGIRDKNGKEIYEGDIVRVGTNYCSFFYKVIFSVGCFRLSDKDGDVWYNLNECDVEVCGNIYDDKSLLED